MKKYILVIIYILLSVVGLVLMKLGGNTGSLEFADKSFTFTMNFISLAGFVSYILSFLLFTNIIVKFDLSYITPISSGLVQVFTLISGFVIFEEKITFKGVLGAFIVIIGVIIMNMKDNKSENKLKNEQI